MLQAHDLRHINEDTLERTIKIPTGDINATDFGLNEEEIDFLYNSGYTSTKNFLSTWDFEQHKANRLQRMNKTSKIENSIP